jgi:hypothetical protein
VIIRQYVWGSVPHAPGGNQSERRHRSNNLESWVCHSILLGLGLPCASLAANELLNRTGISIVVFWCLSLGPDGEVMFIALTSADVKRFGGASGADGKGVCPELVRLIAFCWTL